MKRNRYRTVIIFLGAMLALSACGGGGGGSGSTTYGTTSTPPTKAVVKLSTFGASTQIAGIDVTIALPGGVTAKATVAPPETDSGVVLPSGQAAVNSIVEATYSAATGSAPAAVHILLANSNTNGFGIGEFATINCDLASGATPTSSDFTVESATVGDPTGNPIPGITVSASVTLE